MNNNSSANSRTLIETGIKQLQAGQAGDAEKTFLDVLDLSPNDPGVLHLLGLSRHFSGNHSGAVQPITEAVSLVPTNESFLNSLGQVHQALGDAGEALQCFSRAAGINPAAAGTHLNLGNALKSLDRFDDALSSYRVALDLQPDFAEAHFNLAVTLVKLGQNEEALASFRQSLALKPDFPQALCEMGNVLHQLGEMEEAVETYQQFISLAPDLVQAETYVNMADILGGLDRPRDAVDSYQRALVKKPEFTTAYINRGNTLKAMGRLEDAKADFIKARDIDPGICEPYVGLGNVLKAQNRLDDAISCYRQAIAVDPNNSGAHDNLGTALKLQGRLEDAVASFHESLRLEPDNAKVHCNLSMVFLLMGRLREGWAEFHWRWRVEDSAGLRIFPHAVWPGGDPKNKTILVWPEQGVGDEIMFSSMILDLVDAGARVVLESDPRLVPLFRRSFPDVSCIAKVSPASPSSEAYSPTIDFQLPSGDLGQWFRNDFKAFPQRRSYLVADTPRRDAIRQRYQDGTGDLLVGIAWHSMNDKFGDLKSLALNELRPLAEVPGIRLVDLQYGDTVRERAAFKMETGHSVLHDDDIDQMAALDGFAAQVAALDLVVTISNTTAHVAGALGIPTWVLLHTAPLSCWMMDREDSPWYPSVQLFRQPRPGDWGDVIGRVVHQLGQLISA